MGYKALWWWATLAVLGLMAPEAACVAGQVWLDQHVTWKDGKDGLEWRASFRGPQRNNEYQLALRPLWAVEGGVIAIEIVVARPARPNVNLLGDRQNDIQYPFVITVNELRKGIAKSKYGRVRQFQFNGLALHAEIARVRLGYGVVSGRPY